MDTVRQTVYNALSTVEDPDLKRDLVSLGMVKAIEDNGTEVVATIALTTPACPLKEVIRERCETAIHSFLQQAGIGRIVKIDLTSEVTTARAAGPVLPGVRNIIAVTSGKGGVGKSTVTANLAYALAQTGARVGLIDADISGPSIPTMFGVEDEQPGMVQINGRNMIVPVERYGVKLLSIGFLTPPGSAVIWRGPMMSSALRQFIQDTDWGDLDYMFFDMPPGTSDIHLTLVQTVPVTGAVVVTTPQKVALADARKAVAMFNQGAINVPVLGIVENMSWFEPAELPGSRYYLFGKGGGNQLGDEYGIPLLGQIPLVQSVREAGDEGLPIVASHDLQVSEAFNSLAETVARQIAIRNAGIGSLEPVEVAGNE